MLGNYFTYEEETSANRHVVPQKNAENTIDGEWDQREFLIISYLARQ